MTAYVRWMTLHGDACSDQGPIIMYFSFNVLSGLGMEVGMVPYRRVSGGGGESETGAEVFEAACIAS